MRRDTIFYQLFLRFPQLLFELVPNKPPDAEQYKFEAIEVKETSFRADGAWMPPTPSGTVYFAEVQFQPDEIFYERMNAEISVFTFRSRDRCDSWQGIVLFPTRKLQQSNLNMVSHLLDSGKIIPIFLDELPSDASPALKLMVLTTLEGETAIDAAKQALAQGIGNCDIIEMVTTIMVYKFTQLTRVEIDAMLGVTLQETRVYQEAKAEGKLEGKAEGKLEGKAEGKLEGKAEGKLEGKAEGKLEGKAEGKLEVLLMLFNRNFGALPASLTEQIKMLPIEQLEFLCNVAFDFQNLADLTVWLNNED